MQTWCEMTLVQLVCVLVFFIRKWMSRSAKSAKLNKCQYGDFRATENWSVSIAMT